MTSYEELNLKQSKKMKNYYIEEIPSWATNVVSRIERRPSGITYAILLEADNSYRGTAFSHRSLFVWSKEVLFDTVNCRHAGCYPFQEALQEQEMFAKKYAEQIVGGKMTELYVLHRGSLSNRPSTSIANRQAVDPFAKTIEAPFQKFLRRKES